MPKQKIKMNIAANEKIAENVFSMTLECREGDTFGTILPGQFVGIYLNDPSRLLPRPISICSFDESGKRLRLVYRISGQGTLLLSQMKAGETADVLGILGNGYDLTRLSGRRVLLIGGGIGAPPLLGLARRLRKEANTEITAVLGYRTSDLFLAEEFREICNHVVIATDDGTAGVRGTVIDAVAASGIEGFDAICACGPLPMLEGVKLLAQQWDIPAWISMEERMACGVGACLGCVTKTVHEDAHSHVHNARICTEGPVFMAEDVIL